jgi:TonB family protein
MEHIVKPQSVAEPGTQEVGLLSALTLVLWIVCLAVGVTGLRLEYPHPQPPPAAAPPVQAQILNVEVTRDRLLAPAAPASPANPLMAPLPRPPQSPSLAPPATASLTPLNLFVTPATAPVQIVATTRPALESQPRPSVQELTLGEGEGQQPQPEYPLEAEIARQTGVVIVRFSVGEDGGVSNVLVKQRCPWPLLNQSALRAVRETWRFPPGPPRLYEVRIVFQSRN